MRKWLVNNTSVYFFSSPGLLEHDFMKKTAIEKRWNARVSRLKCTRSPRPVDRGRPQCPVSYPDNNSASRLFRSGTFSNKNLVEWEEESQLTSKWPKEKNPTEVILFTFKSRNQCSDNGVQLYRRAWCSDKWPCDVTGCKYLRLYT